MTDTPSANLLRRTTGRARPEMTGQTLWNACTQEPAWWLRWIECHPSTSQTVFSVVAIVGAAVIPTALYLAQRRARKLERLEKSGSLATGLIGAIWLLETEIDRVERELARYRDDPPSTDAWNAWFGDLILNIPQPLTAALPQMLEAQENIIGPFRQSEMLAVTFNGYVARFQTLRDRLQSKDWPQLHERISSSLQLTRKAVSEAQNIINSARVVKSL